MSTHKPSTLSAGLVAVKGQAAAGAQPQAAPATPATVYFKAMTLKVDQVRYRRLKQMGLELDKTSQQLLIEALDALLDGRI